MDMNKLEGLGDLVEEVDAEGPPTPQQQEEQKVVDAAEQSAAEWGTIVYMLGNAAAMIAPELSKVYTQEACLNWGRSMNPVASKYGWNGPGGVPELGLLIATAGLVVPSWFAIRARLAAVNTGTEKTGWLAGMREWWLNRKRKAAPAATPIDGVEAAA